MINKIKNFYFDFSPNFSERYTKKNIRFLFSKFVKDEFSNIAVMDSKSDLHSANSEFLIRNLEPSYYSFEKPSKNFKITYQDDFLFFENISTLFKKFSRFKSKNVKLIEVNTQQLISDYYIINDKCYSDNSSENPYSNLDNFAYSKNVIDSQKNETLSKTLIYIIQFNNINVGCINITIYEDLCYVSGLAILKEYRKTKVFSVLIDVLEILINLGVKNVFCVTELNEYPDKLYKKLGFKSIAIAYGYKNITKIN